MLNINQTHLTGVPMTEDNYSNIAFRPKTASTKMHSRVNNKSQQHLKSKIAGKPIQFR